MRFCAGDHSATLETFCPLKKIFSVTLKYYKVLCWRPFCDSKNILPVKVMRGQTNVTKLSNKFSLATTDNSAPCKNQMCRRLVRSRWERETMMAVLVAFTPAVLHTDDTSGGVSIRFRFIAMVVHGLCEAVVNQVFPHVVRHQYRFLVGALSKCRPRRHRRQMQNTRCKECASFPPPLQVEIWWVHAAYATCWLQLPHQK